MTLKNSESTLESLVTEPVSRRSALKRSGLGAAALALGVPAGLSVLSQTAVAQGSATASLSAALQLKYMADDLYNFARKPTGPVAVTNLISTMRTQEQAHITKLQALIGSGYPAKASVNITDWTCHGLFPSMAGVATIKEYFDLARYLEDLCVRVLKGAIVPLFGDAAKLQDVMAMNTVDARQAAIARAYRRGLRLEDTDYAFNNGTTEAASGHNIAIYALVGSVGPDDLWSVPDDAPTGPPTNASTAKSYLSYYVYGPAEASFDNNYASTGEDNRFHPPNTASNFNNDYMTDEPVGADAATKFIQAFAASV